MSAFFSLLDGPVLVQRLHVWDLFGYTVPPIKEQVVNRAPPCISRNRTSSLKDIGVRLLPTEVPTPMETRNGRDAHCRALPAVRFSLRWWLPCLYVGRENLVLQSINHAPRVQQLFTVLRPDVDVDKTGVGEHRSQLIDRCNPGQAPNIES